VALLHEQTFKITTNGSFFFVFLSSNFFTDVSFMIEIIPAIDIIQGKCVRLSQGDYEKKIIYNESPLEVAKTFEDAGIRRLHLVDLDGAKAQHIVNHKVLEQIASKTKLIIDFGGGLKSDNDLQIAFESGASMVTGGSIAVKQPDVFSGWIECYGYEKIILGADVKDEKIAVGGWLETSELNLFPFLESYVRKGISKVICTDISKDGMLLGPSIELYRKIISRFPELYLIASGGVSSIEDIVALQEANIPAVIVGKAIYEGRISLKALGKYLA
jgi:phosphoribosylformimino-5-aminoimidazole carboxamide ribotide isomerase